MPSTILEPHFGIRTDVSEAQGLMQPHAAIVGLHDPGIGGVKTLPPQYRQQYAIERPTKPATVRFRDNIDGDVY